MDGLHYKNNFDKIKEKNKNKMFDQSRVSIYTSEPNTILVYTLFGKDKWILSPQNCPDLVYLLKLMGKSEKICKK